MNKIKAIKLKIAHAISKDYLRKSFQDLETEDRIKVYNFSDWLVYNLQVKGGKN